MPTMCALYVRVSSEQQREKYSLPSQRQILTDYAQRQGWEVKLYDEGVGSGETITDRPMMRMLLEDARQGVFQVCLVIELERLSRDQDLFDWLTIKQVFRQRNIKIATPNQAYDLNDAEDDFLSDLFGALSKREKRKFMERAKRGRDEAVRRGRYIGSHFCLGHRYSKDTGKLSIIPKEAAVIREIFRLCNEEGLGITSIAERLNRKQVPTPMQWARAAGRLKLEQISWRRGSLAGRHLAVERCRWTAGTVYRILTNPRYYGAYYFNKFDGTVRKRRDRQEWIAQTIEPIINKETFDTAQLRLKERTNWPERSVKANYLLRGLLFCSDCGQRLHGVTFKAHEQLDVHGKPLRNAQGERLKRWKTSIYYRCYGRHQNSQRKCRMPYLPAQQADQVVWEAIRECVKRPQHMLDLAFEQQRAILHHTRTGLPQAIQERERELDRIQKGLNRILDAYSYGDLDRVNFRSQMEKLKARRESIESELSVLRMEVAGTNGKDVQLKALQASLAEVKARVDTLSENEKVDLLHKWLTRIVVHPDGGLDVKGVLEGPATAVETLPRAGPRSLRGAGPDYDGHVPRHAPSA